MSIIIFSELSRLISIRKKQPAFNPNATQFTFHLGAQMFGFWRQSIDRTQSIFCISNISKQSVSLALADINLICTDFWVELISDAELSDMSASLDLSTYQTVWITNRVR